MSIGTQCEHNLLKSQCPICGAFEMVGIKPLTKSRKELIDEIAKCIYVHRHEDQWIRMFDLSKGKIEELTPLQVCKERPFIYSKRFDRTVVEYETDNPRIYTISPYGNFESWILDELSERLSLEAEHIFQSAEALVALIEQSIEAKYVGVVEALEFYANPETYFAIGFFPDPPCGDFMDDFTDTVYLGDKPGKRAREALKELDL